MRIDNFLIDFFGFFTGFSAATGGVTGFSITPYEICCDHLALMDDEKRQWFFNRLKQVSEPLKCGKMIESAWHGFLRRYGLDGFRQEIAMLMDKLTADPPKGAAMFRNRVATMQHRHHWIDALTRVMDGTIDEAPDWAVELTRLWMTETRK